jgi:cytochrome c-type biogenesis protein CcmH
MTTSAAPVAFDITAVKRQLQELQALHASGALSREFYEEGRARLERRILDWVLLEAPAAEPAGAPAVQPLMRPSWQLWATLAGVVLLVAVLGYSWSGYSSARLTDSTGGGAAAAGEKPHSSDVDQITAMTEKLAARLQDKPQDAEGWAMLARSYNMLGRNPEAINSYEKAIALSGDDAVLLADYADALAVKNNRSLAGEPMKWVARALKNDPHNLKALSLAGAYAFEKKDYANAVKYWEQVVQFGAADNRLVEQVQSSLVVARELAASSTASPPSPR